MQLHTCDGQPYFCAKIDEQQGAVHRQLTFAQSSDGLLITLQAAAGAVLQPASSRAWKAACFRTAGTVCVIPWEPVNWEFISKELAARRCAAPGGTLFKGLPALPCSRHSNPC
jgi:hypothetical protein